MNKRIIDICADQIKKEILLCKENTGENARAAYESYKTTQTETGYYRYAYEVRIAVQSARYTLGDDIIWTENFFNLVFEIWLASVAKWEELYGFPKFQKRGA